MQRQTPPPRARSAYTLLELLLALAVVSVLAGVTIPSALRMYADSNLSDAAEKVRNLVGETRINAINTGEQYQFRFEKDGRHFVQLPVEVPVAATDQTTAATTTPAVPRPPSVLGTLPEGMRFESLAAETPMAGSAPESPLPPELFQGLPKPQELVSLSWSAPIIYSADGSANDASWLVVDQRKESIRVDVRGLTGAASIGAILPFKDR